MSILSWFKKEKLSVSDDELKEAVNTVLNNRENKDETLFEEVFNIVKKIVLLPKRKVFTVAKLINYNPETTVVNPLRQGTVLNCVKKTCSMIKIELVEASKGFTGLAYHYKLKKI